MFVRRIKSEKGVVSAALLVGLAMASAITISILSLALLDVRNAKVSYNNTVSAATADAGAERAMWELVKHGTPCTSLNVSGTVTTINGAALNYTIVPSVVGADCSLKVTGQYVVTGVSTPPQRVVRVTAKALAASHFAVQAGPGGLIQTNNSAIASTDIYVSGYIDQANNTTIVAPNEVDVGLYQCPSGASPGATFPAQCGSGTPISFSNGSSIAAPTVKAYLVNCADSHIVILPGGSGCSNASVPALVQPDPGRNAMKCNADPNKDRADGDASCVNAQSNAIVVNGDLTCTAGLMLLGGVGKTGIHIKGNVDLNTNGCVATVFGDVWIDGTFTTKNNASILVAASVLTPPQLAVDGQGGFSIGNGGTASANLLGIGMTIVTYWSADASCNPNCPTVTGNNLCNSIYNPCSSSRTSGQRYTIDLSNNASIGVGVNLFARWTGVWVSNNGTVGSIYGQTIHLSNNGTISVSTPGGSSGGGFKPSDYTIKGS